LRLALGYKSLIADWRHFRLRVFALYGELREDGISCAFGDATKLPRKK
jgi:hypothetical protein